MSTLEGHILLCGLGKVGFSILELLHGLGERVVVITREIPADWAARAESMSARIIRGDARAEGALLKAGLCQAAALIVATDNDLTNIEVTLDAHRLAPEVPVVLRLYDTDLAERVKRDMPVRAVLNAADLAAPAFVAAALGDRILRAFDIEDTFIHIVSLEVADRSKGAGETLGQLGERCGVIPLALAGTNKGHATAPSLDTVLQTGDEVIAAASRSALAALQHASGRRHRFSHRHIHQDGARVPRLWVHQRQTPLGMARSIWSRASAPLRYAFVGLNLVVLASICVYHFGWSLGWLDALYFSISTLTTVGYGDISVRAAPAPIKLFTCLVMIAGMALTIIFFSIVTEYLVTQRFEQLLGRKRTALRDHVVVVGLGNVGRRVAQRLHELGEPVLAIERSPDVAAASGLADVLPIVAGDATGDSVMEQAGVERAAAVLAVTDSDLANLRVAHYAEARNPDTRTVARLFESTLAAKLGRTFLGVHQALNPSQAAAATFAACALMPDVLHGFALGGRLLVVRWLDPGRLELCHGRSVGEMRDALSILALLRRRGPESPLEDLEADDVIAPGDRLVILEEYRPHEHAVVPPTVSALGTDEEPALTGVSLR